jgi:hypothetical protein
MNSCFTISNYRRSTYSLASWFSRERERGGERERVTEKIGILFNEVLTISWFNHVFTNKEHFVELSWAYLTADSQSTSSSWYRAPFWGPWPDFIRILYLVTIALLFFLVPSLTTERVCNLRCNRWLVKSLRTNNHILLSHLRLGSIFVASYDSQGLRWRYSNPPPHGEEWDLYNISYIGIQFVPHRIHITSFQPA